MSRVKAVCVGFLAAFFGWAPESMIDPAAQYHPWLTLAGGALGCGSWCGIALAIGLAGGWILLRLCGGI